jgi:drug/metabolite transporter (DMT)-like permease
VVWVRYAYDAGVTPGTAIFLRFALASAALAVFLRWSGLWVDLPAGQVAALFLLGLLTYTLMGIGWFTALSVTPAWLVSLFVALFPLPVALGSWLFLGEGVEPQQVLALLAVVAGGVALFWRPFEGDVLTGSALMLLVVTANAVYVLAGQRWTQGTHPGMTTLWTALGATLGTLAYSSLSRQLTFRFAAGGWGWAGLFAVVSTGAAIMLLWEGIAHIGPSRASIIGSLEPLFSIVLSVLVLGERMTMLQMSGGALILLGVLLVQLPGRAGQ